MTTIKNKHSLIEPQEFTIAQNEIIINSNITSQSKQIDENLFVTEYIYNQNIYTKDEYIQIMAHENEALKEQILTTQEAVCELYEMLLDGE